jgi:tRNA uridine 5-carboxymethylaminomethyl modification enzyme
LLLRQDNADRRLTPLGHKVGLVSESRWQRLAKKEAEIARVFQLLCAHRRDEITLEKLLRRPETGWSQLIVELPELEAVDRYVQEQVISDVKYAGYVARQQTMVERQRRMAIRRIPDNFDYEALRHLRREAKEKLIRFRPVNIAQAQNISGITPADIALVMLHLDAKSQSAR